MEIEQKDKSSPAHSIEFVEQKDRYISKLESEIKALRDLLGEVRRTFGNDTKVVQILPEKDSYYTPIWIKKIDQLLTKNEG